MIAFIILTFIAIVASALYMLLKNKQRDDDFEILDVEDLIKEQKMTNEEAWKIFENIVKAIESNKTYTITNGDAASQVLKGILNGTYNKVAYCLMDSSDLVQAYDDEDECHKEVVEKYKQKLMEATNIETNADEMKVIDNILFRFWQMGWLDAINQQDALPNIIVPRAAEGNYEKALKQLISDMSDIEVDFSEQCAITENRKKLLNDLIEKYGWSLGIEQYYLTVSYAEWTY